MQNAAERPVWTLGDRIRKARRRMGLTVQEFAERLDVTASALGQYETDRSIPRDVVELARKIELVTHVPAVWTLGLDDCYPPTSPLPVIHA
jgi:transcriptional regulator with XRE-family HTH domain